MSTTVWSYNELIQTQELLYNKLANINVLGSDFKHLFSALTLMVCIPLSRWLADQKLGNFKVFKAGCVIMFLGSVSLCLGILVLKNIDSNGRGSFIASIIVASLTDLVFFSGGSASLVTVAWIKCLMLLQLIL